MSNTEPQPQEQSPPTQEQLARLRDTILAYEPNRDPFALLPPELATSDLTNMQLLAVPPLYNEREAPSRVLKAPDNRAIWLSVFRNPDTNAIHHISVMILDPEVNQAERSLLEDEYYNLEEEDGKLTIKQADENSVAGRKVEDLQMYIDLSEPFDLSTILNS